MIYPPSVQIQSLPGAGKAVAFNLVGDALVIGNTKNAAAYVYTGTPGSTPYKLSTTLGWVGSGVGFGSSVAISDVGDVIVVCFPITASQVGSAYVFRKTGPNVWDTGSSLNPNDNLGASLYGFSVALSGDGSTLAVGGCGDDSGTGAIWMYKYVASAWVVHLGGKLVASGLDVTTPPANLGRAVGLDTTGTILAAVHRKLGGLHRTSVEGRSSFSPTRQLGGHRPSLSPRLPPVLGGFTRIDSMYNLATRFP